jgi:hypothetical protein
LLLEKSPLDPAPPVHPAGEVQDRPIEISPERLGIAQVAPTCEQLKERFLYEVLRKLPVADEEVSETPGFLGKGATG